MYDSAVAAFARGELDWEGAQVRVMLLTDDYVPSQSSDELAALISRYEVEPSGSYHRGGAELRGRSVVRSELGGDVKLTGASVSWEGFTGAFRYAVVRADDRVVAYADLGAQQASNASVSLSYEAGVAEFLVVS